MAAGGSTTEDRPRKEARSKSDQQRAGVLSRPLTSYYLTLGAGLLLLIIGLLMVFSASFYPSMNAKNPSVWTFFGKQALFAAIGLVALYVAALTPPRVYQALSGPLLLAVVLLLVLVAFFGKSVGGNTNWLVIGGLSIQPSEFAKLALALWGADLLVRKRKLINQWKHLLIPLVPVAGVVMLLIMVGKDLGTCVILMAVLLALLWVVGAPMRLFGGLAATLGLLVGLLFVIPGAEHRLDRFNVLIDPWSYADGVGYQPIHAMYALATGGLFGSGIGLGAQKLGYLFNQPHTDFIFAVIGEELGLVGTLSILGLYATLGYAGLRIATRSRDPFVRYAAGAITVWLLVQTMVNVGGVIRVLPIAGLPLPFVSYGGTALLACMTALGVLLSFARHEPGAQAALAARGPGLAARVRSRLTPHRKNRKKA